VNFFKELKQISALQCEHKKLNFKIKNQEYLYANYKYLLNPRDYCAEIKLKIHDKLFLFLQSYHDRYGITCITDNISIIKSIIRD